MASPVRWLGGKGRLADAILKRLLPHKAYVETCCGGAAVFWAKPKDISAAEILNDRDGELINFYSVLHKRGRKLAAELDAMPYSRSLFQKLRAARLRGSFSRAVRFWYVNRVCFGGRRRNPSFGVDASRRALVLPPRVLGDLDATIQRLRGVSFESLDVVRLIELYDRPDTLFYVDPPFWGLSQGYVCQFTQVDHERLSRALVGIKGMFLLSYNDCSQIRRLYAGCRFSRLATSYTIGRNSAAGRKAGGTGPARELLISNHPLRRVTRS